MTGADDGADDSADENGGRTPGGAGATLPFTDDADIGEEVALVELLNNVLDRGVYVSGDVVVSVAGIDLLYVGLRVLLSSVETLEAAGRLPGGTDADEES